MINSEIVSMLLKDKLMVIGMEINNVGVECCVCVDLSHPNLTLTLRNENSRMPYPRLYAEYIVDDKNQFMTKYHITDVYAVQKRVGNGSILIQHLINWAKKMKVCEITGSLSEVDAKKFDELEKFYVGHGFTVTFNESKTAGKIKMEI